MAGGNRNNLVAALKYLIFNKILNFIYLLVKNYFSGNPETRRLIDFENWFHWLFGLRKMNKSENLIINSYNKPIAFIIWKIEFKIKLK